MNFSEASHEITDYIVGYYSILRPHKYNSVVPPNELENRYWKKAKTVVNLGLSLQYVECVRFKKK